MHPQSITVPLTQGKHAIIDADDYERVCHISWSAKRGRHTWYAVGNRKDEVGRWRFIAMHRLIADAAPDEQVDHWDGNGLNNRKINLRRCTLTENTRNRRAATGSASQYKGVYPAKRGTRWIATISAGEGQVVIGRYDTEEEAARAYDTAARRYHGEFARLNFPDEQVEVLSTVGGPRRGGKSTAGFRGISLDPKTHKWKASIMHEGKRHHLGYFTDPADAARAYDGAARRLKPGSPLNFPD